MRAQVKNACETYGVAVKSSVITTDDLLNADEVFITNAVAGIVPVQALYSPDQEILKHYLSFSKTEVIAKHLENNIKNKYET